MNRKYPFFPGCAPALAGGILWVLIFAGAALLLSRLWHG